MPRRIPTDEGSVASRATASPGASRHRAPSGLRATEFRFEGQDHLLLSFVSGFSATARRHGLTEAEHAVALLILRGLSNERIAYVRAATPRTIANQIASIYRKLKIGSRSELAAIVADSVDDSAPEEPR